MNAQQARDVGFGFGVHVVRFGVIVLGLWLAPILGISGWYSGLFVNVLCVLFAAGLVSYYRLWRVIGFLTLTRGRIAVLLLAPTLVEAVFRIFPSGLIDQPPGFGLWGLTLLLVGINEELISRGVVLERMRRNFPPLGAVAVTAALFGLQHLSAFATTGRGAVDILTNVLASAAYGFALAAFQYRFSWIWPLILIHAVADLTTILSGSFHGGVIGEVTAVLTSLAFVVYGVFVLRAQPLDGTSRGRAPIARL